MIHAPAEFLCKLNATLVLIGECRVKQLAFLVLPGSFNPVHSQHLRAMEIAREVITNLGWRVIGGFLAPSDDGYVQRKLGDAAWPLAKRLELCRLATDNLPWVEVVPWGEFSSYRVTSRLQQVVESNCHKELRGRAVIGVEVMGSDAAVRILGKLVQDSPFYNAAKSQRYHQRFVCCLLRPGPNGHSEIQQIRIRIQPQAAAIGIKIIISDDERTNLLQEVSSQEILKAVAMRQWEQLRENGWLSPSVLSRLQSDQ
jgi:nicotinic acid mononucleotide adenylyltransferase